MKQLVVILILMSNLTFVFGQLPSDLPNDISKTKSDLPDKIKIVRQYQDNFLLNVRIYDTLGNEIFSHYKQYVHENWNGKYITMISASIFDDFGKAIKLYNLHSNAGLSIQYYEYDNLGNNTKTYQRNNDYEDDDDLINTNPFHYISEIKNIDELINHSKIKEIELVAKKNLCSENILDSVGNVIKEIFYKENGDSVYIRYEYDKNKNKIYSYHSGNERFSETEYYFEYEKKYSFFEEDLQKEPRQSNLLQSVRIDYDWREKRKRISDITHYKYDNEDRLIETIEYSEGKFQAKYLYEYNDLNQITKRTSYVYNLDKIASEETYLYNQEGNVIEETDKDFRAGKETVNKYHYEYEYYE